jgi:hypothetical protein
MNKPDKVSRSDYKYAHSYLLKRPILCIFLTVAFTILGWALYSDLLGHSNNSPHWESKNMIGAGIAWISAIILAVYAAKGVFTRSKT